MHQAPFTDQIQSQPPLSPRSALRLLQEPSTGHVGHHGGRTVHPSPSSSSLSSAGSGGAATPGLVRPPPPRKSSLAVNSGVPLHLPMPPQPMLEEEPSLSASPTQSPLLVPRPTPQCPPRVTARSASKSAFSVPRQQLPPMIPQRKSYSSARSIHSVSDTSSVVSLPLMTPPDPSNYQSHTQYPLPTIYQSQSQPHLPASEHRFPVSIHQRTSSMAYHAQTLPRRSEEDSPFAYSVDGATAYSSASMRASFSSREACPPSHASEQRQRYAGHLATQHGPWHGSLAASSPKRNLHRPPQLQGRPARSVDDYVAPLNSASTVSYAGDSRYGASRTSLPNSVHYPERTSYEDQYRVLAPLRRSPATVSHRTSLSSLVSEPSLPHRSTMYTSPSQMDNEGEADAASVVSLPHTSSSSAKVASPALSAKRPRRWTGNEHAGEKQPASQRRSESADRRSVADSKLDHAEVMAKLNKKMRERIAAKNGAVSGKSSGAQVSATDLHSYRTSSEKMRRRGDSTASSIPPTPESSIISIGSPATTHRRSASPETETETSYHYHHHYGGHRPSSEVRPSPIIGIESLLSAAALTESSSMQHTSSAHTNESDRPAQDT